MKSEKPQSIFTAYCCYCFWSYCCWHYCYCKL